MSDFQRYRCHGIRFCLANTLSMLALLATIMGIFAGTAHAQDADSTAAPSRPQDRLEEVIVTAQKRAENVRDVPISISVFNGDQLREAGIKSFNDMARFMPNVTLNDGSNSLYVRGIGTPELNPIGEQAVAYIVDGVYVPKYSYLKAGFMDLERIEMLKGPQGTLFGRNATAGVINITNGRPTEEWTAYASVTQGDRDIREAEMMLSGPITDAFSARLAVKQRKEEGSTISVTDNDTLGDRDQKMARLSLRYDITESLDVQVSATRFDYFIGAFLAYEFHEFPDDLRPVAESLDPNFESNFDRRTSLRKHHKAPSENRTEGDGWIVPLEINWEVWGHTLTSVTGYGTIESFDGGDVDFLDADLVGLTVDLVDEQWSQELRITSPPGALEYTLGMYYLEGEADSKIEVPLYGGFASIASVGPLSMFTAIGDVLGSILGTDSEVLDTLGGNYLIKTESTGIFGQLKWSMTDYLSLTFGIRKSKDIKDGRIQGYTTGPVPFWTQFSDAPFDESRKLVDKDTSPKLSLSWDITEDITFYATRSYGFRAGSFNAGATEIQNLTFEAESSETTEVGIKSELLDSRVRFNFGLFKTDYEDYQLSVFTGLGYATANAPEVRMEGIESDVTALLLPGLIVNASVGYNDAKYESYPNAGCPTPSFSESTSQGELVNPFRPKRDCDLTGQRLHRAPKFTGSLRIDYTLNLGQYGWPFDLFAGADATYKDDEFMDADLDPLDFQEAYWLYGARLGIKSVMDTWRFEVHGKNLTDELVKTHSGDPVALAGAHVASANDPRYVFASFSYRY